MSERKEDFLTSIDALDGPEIKPNEQDFISFFASSISSWAIKIIHDHNWAAFYQLQNSED